MLSDYELLHLQAELALDERGRISRMCGVSMSASGGRLAHWIGSDVPEEIARPLESILAAAHDTADNSAPPHALEACGRVLSQGLEGPWIRRHGPSFVFTDNGRRALHATGDEVRVVRSDASDASPLREANPGNWGDGEWSELLAGELGPWAIALAGDRVVSICHTPRRMTDRAAECGVWTHPDARGRGYAAAVAAEWADVLRPTGRHLFYSTDATNHSSRRVAERLNLRPIGWIWQVMRQDASALERAHPLSRAARTRSPEQASARGAAGKT